jgi:hypothetical protein
MEEEGGAKVHFLDEASRTFNFLPIVVASNLCFKCSENNN